MNKKQKKWLRTIILFSLGILALYFSLKNTDLTEIKNILLESHWGFVALSFIIALFSHVFRSIRWNIILEPMGYQAKKSNAFYAVMIGYLMNYVFPRLGEVSRCAALSQTDNIPFEKLVGTIVAERIVDLMMVLLIGLLILFSQYDLLLKLYEENIASQTQGNGFLSNVPVIPLLIIFLGLALGTIIVWKTGLFKKFNQKIQNFIQGFIDGLKSILKMKKVGLFIVYSLSIWMCYFLAGYVIFFALEPTSHLGLGAAATALFMGTVAVILPLPGGLGSYQILVPLGLSVYGISKEAASAYAILTPGIQLIMFVIVGIFSLIMVANQKKSKLSYESLENNRK